MSKLLSPTKIQQKVQKVVNRIPAKVRPVVFASLFAVIGLVVLLSARADTPPLSVELETGVKNSNITTVDNPTASAGQAVRFGSTVTQPPTAVARFAGNVPGRVLLGMAASSSIRPLYDEALQITGPVYERRLFTPNWITTSNMTNMLNDCTANNQYCVISFKVPNNDWVGVTQGKYDAGLDTAMAVARTRSQPFAFAVHHEPTNDGVPEEWAAMQEYLVQYLAPVNDKMAFTAIANGFHWGLKQPSTPAVQSSYFPDSLIAKFNQYKGIVAADFYDAKPDANGVYKTNADRTSMKMQGFTTWARQKGIKSIGAGEFGTTTGAELAASWKVMHDNSDIWGYGNYFNSLANSDWDWRLIPSNYPIYAPTNALDQGGTAVSQARLDAFKAAVVQSSSPN